MAVTAPPHDLEAERALLSAAMIDADAADVVARAPADLFYMPAHAEVAAVIGQLAAEGIPAEPTLVADRLARRGQLEQVGGHQQLVEILAVGGLSSAAGHYADVLYRHRRDRALHALVAEADIALREGRGDDALKVLATAVGDGHLDTDAEQLRPERGHALGDWLLDTPTGIPAVWGHDDEVLWAEGEPLLIAAPPGVGKTTIFGQLVFARLGLLDDVLGYPVAPTSSRALYLAMDRPRQIQRALGRLARPDDRDALNDRCHVRIGPPPRDIAKHPEVLASLARGYGADTVFVDSLKDAAVGLSDDEVGAGINRAMQIAMAEGVELAIAHHQRKGQNGTKPKTLQDVYGSTWITAGVGSVVLLWGKPGDANVELSHLKQPGATVGPLQIEHDHIAGRSRVSEGFDLLAYLRGQPRPVDTAAVARARYNTEPSRNQLATVRAQLNRAADRGTVVKVDPVESGAGGTPAARWAVAEQHREAPR